jgi:hypothetical protein
MSALDGLDDLASWLDARSGLVEEWLACCEFAPAAEGQPTPAPPATAPLGHRVPVAFAGTLFGSDGGQSSGGGSSGWWALAA